MADVSGASPAGCASGCLQSLLASGREGGADGSHPQASHSVPPALVDLLASATMTEKEYNDTYFQIAPKPGRAFPWREEARQAAAAHVTTPHRRTP
jgi:hypothetical protein